MAEKHKSKYKKPENTKYKSRKDLKDYTMDDKEGNLNPKSTGEKQSNVLRKTDKEVIDNGSLVPKYDANDRLYKDLEDGDYDPKHAAKVFKKRQDDGEKSSEKNLKDKDYNLTREQKEELVRKYVRRKIEKVLSEQTIDTTETSQLSASLDDVLANLKKATKEAQRISQEDGVSQHVNHIGKGQFDVSNWYDSDNTVSSFANGRRINEQVENPVPEETPEETPAPEEAPIPNAETPAPAAAPAPAEAPAPAPADQQIDTELSPESKVAVSIEKFVKQLQADGGNISRIKTLAKVFNLTMKDVDIEDKVNFYKLLKQLASKKLSIVEIPHENK